VACKKDETYLAVGIAMSYLLVHFLDCNEVLAGVRVCSVVWYLVLLLYEL
jgi:hypothetical protein